MTMTKGQKIITQMSDSERRLFRKRMDIAVQIAEKIKNSRKTQKEFAKMIKMKESQLSRILCGHTNITLKTITKIESALDTDIIIAPMFNENIKVSEPVYKDVTEIIIASSNQTDFLTPIDSITHYTPGRDFPKGYAEAS